MGMKHALVTGGAGFIGFHLSRRLLMQGWRVTCVDDLSTGSVDNAQTLVSRYPNNYVWHNADIREDLCWLEERYEVVYNLASPASPMRYVDCPIKTIESNVVGVANVLEIAQRDSAILVQASTSEVYGDPTEHPQSERYWGNVNPVGQRSCYDEGKRAAEAMVSAYRHERGVEGRVVRIFNTYGPRMRLDDGRVVCSFIRNALDGVPLRIHGNGGQTRSFCYVDDTVRALVLAGDPVIDWPEVVNVGNPHEISIRRLAAEVLRLVGGAPDSVEYEPAPIADDPRRRCPDIRLAKEVLGWMPKVGLREGLVETLEYYMSCADVNRRKDANELE